MFGLIPRAVWTRAAPPDEKGRVSLQHNCLLLERLDDVAPSELIPAPKLVLIEAGTGNKLDDKSRDIFAMDDRSILDALDEVACRPEDIGGVVVSHLHFDHAGGLTRLCRAGESADWRGPASCFTGTRGDHSVKRAFPNAAVVAQAREWADAIDNKSVMTRTYFRDHLEAVRDQITQVRSPLPFPPGLPPGKNDQPLGSALMRSTEVFAGIRVFLAPGHTWGQQAVLFHDHTGRTVVFTPDVMPTAWHVGQPYSLGYDVEPYTSMVTRTWFLSEAAAHKWILVLDHEPGNPVRVARSNDRGWYDLQEESL